MPTSPPLFVSHGAPTLLTGQSDARTALLEIGHGLPTPRAYVVVSAHWESDPIRITASRTPATIHDFSGFGDALTRFEYPAEGDDALAEDIAAIISRAGLNVVLDPERGLDHGVWVPLALLKPAPDAPVIQVSLPARPSDDGQSRQLGRALAPLVDQGVQLIFSGAPTHSLRDSLGAPEDAPTLAFASRFNDWVTAQLEAGASLNDWRSEADAGRNHPTPEHLRPLLAAAELGQAERLHHSWTHGALAMDVWRFHAG